MISFSKLNGRFLSPPEQHSRHAQAHDQPIESGNMDERQVEIEVVEDTTDCGP
jgi:hypothetical protein